MSSLYDLHDEPPEPSLYDLHGQEDKSEPLGSPGKAFLKGVQHEATLGYTGEYEPETGAETAANVAGKVVGFAAPALLLSPIGRLGAGVLGLEKSMAAKATIEGLAYGSAEHLDEGESRLRNIAEQGAMFGAGGLAAEALAKGGNALIDYVGSLGDISPKTLMEVARREQLNPGQVAHLEEAVRAQAAKANQGERGFIMKEGAAPTVPAKPSRMPVNPAEMAVVPEAIPSIVQEVSGGVKASDLKGLKPAGLGPMPEDPNAFNFPDSELPSFSPDDVINTPIRALKKDPRKLLTVDQLLEEEAFADPRRTAATPVRNSLYKSGYLTEESELTPLGAQNAELFNWLRPKTIQEKAMAVTQKVLSSADKDFDAGMISPGVKNFVRNEIEGSLGAVTDAYASGKNLAEALDHGIQAHARPRKIEKPSANMQGTFEALSAKSKLAMARAKEILPNLDPDMPAISLAANAKIPSSEAEAIIDELGSMTRAPLKGTAITQPVYKTTMTPTNVLGEDIVTPEILDRALAVSDVTPEMFKNSGFLRPDGTLSSEGKSLLNMLNPEWKIPLTEKVIDKPPVRKRIGNSNRYKTFDVNSPEGRIGLASVRAGGKSNYPLSKETIEGFFPFTAEEGMRRKTPLIRKVGDGYQFTEKGAALAATRNGGIVKEIDVAANRQYIPNKSLGGGDISFEGGRGGKSFSGLSEEEVKRANLDYEVAKATVVEYREAALQYKGCPPGEE